MNMRKLLASGRWVEQVAVITYSADLPSIFIGCDYMVFLPSISLCNEKEGIRNWLFVYLYKHKFWVAISEKINVGYLQVVGENGLKWAIDRWYLRIGFWMVSTLVDMLISYKFEKWIKSMKMVEKCLQLVHIFWWAGDSHVANKE